MNDSDLLWERQTPEDTPQDKASEGMGQQDDTLRALTETTETIEQLSRDLAAWHEHQAVLQDNLQSLSQQLTNHSNAEHPIMDEQLNENLSNLVHTLDERLGRVHLEQRFARLEEQLVQLSQNIQIHYSDVTYIKEKMQITYGILIAVPAFFLVSLLLWLWVA